MINQKFALISLLALITSVSLPMDKKITKKEVEKIYIKKIKDCFFKQRKIDINSTITENCRTEVETEMNKQTTFDWLFGKKKLNDFTTREELQKLAEKTMLHTNKWGLKKFYEIERNEIIEQRNVLASFANANINSNDEKFKKFKHLIEKCDNLLVRRNENATKFELLKHKSDKARSIADQYAELEDSAEDFITFNAGLTKEEKESGKKDMAKYNEKSLEFYEKSRKYDEEIREIKEQLNNEYEDWKNEVDES